MARPRKPVEALKLAGTYRKDRHAGRGAFDPEGEIGSYPEQFSTDPAEIWDEIVNLCPPGVLGDADRLHLEILCRLVAELREDISAFNAAKLSQLNLMLGKLGLNPVDRQKLHCEPPEEPEEISRWSDEALLR